MSKKLVARGLQVVVDISVLCIAFALAFLFRFELALKLQDAKLLFFTLPYVVLFQYIVMVLMGVPSITWRYVGLRDMLRITLAVSIAVAVLAGLRLGLEPYSGHVRFLRIPLGVLAMDFVMVFLGITGVRVLRRILAERAKRQHIIQASERKRTLLIGAGKTGSLVAREIVERPDLGLELVGFADDNVVKIGTLIQGAKVLGDTHSLPALVARQQVEQVIITMGTVSPDVIRRLVSTCEKAGLPAKIIPGMHEILDGRINLTRIREVTIDDLLGREAVQLNVEELRAFLSGKCVLISGAGGSIGSELCRQVANLDPERLVLVEQAENALFHIHQELKRTVPEVAIVPCICDICDAERVRTVFSEHRPEVVFHAAAHKHVPMMEWNPGEALKNNVFGTRKLADAADEHGVSAFVLISTDKAVNPTSIMGATKRVAELYIQSMSHASKTKFVAVRFGNVLGSAGSVIPTFKEQIRRGGPVTVTHPEMQRYFMTIPEASQLVMQAAAMGEGGEIFVLDMGKPVKIVQLAQDLIRLSGFSEDEIRIAFTGVRPGEKLFEELSADAENLAKTRHPKIYIGTIEGCTRERVLEQLARMEAVLSSSCRAVVQRALSGLVPEMCEPSEAAAPEQGDQEADQPRVVH